MLRTPVGAVEVSVFRAGLSALVLAFCLGHETNAENRNLKSETGRVNARIAGVTKSIDSLHKVLHVTGVRGNPTWDYGDRQAALLIKLDSLKTVRQDLEMARDSLEVPAGSNEKK
jgi:hypothetical protein